MTNLYGVSDIVKKGNHVYIYIYTQKENFFVVTSKSGVDIRFPGDSRRLYAKETSTSLNDCCVYNVLNTNIEGFTPREDEKAKRV